MQIRLGILGLGTVGQGVLELLAQQRGFFSNNLGFDFHLVALCARSENSLKKASAWCQAHYPAVPLGIGAVPQGGAMTSQGGVPALLGIASSLLQGSVPAPQGGTSVRLGSIPAPHGRTPTPQGASASPPLLTTDPMVLTTDPMLLATHPDIDILIEVAGGEDAPLEIVKAALASGKHVITANKALLAKHGTTLFPLAAKHNRFLAFEAAVGGGIPIIRTLHESLIGNDIQGLACIINGTCNYILTQMSQRGADFDSTLAEAQKLGYAEADPTFDIDGWDALHKVSLLASLAYGRYIDYRALHLEGIRGISSLDIEMAEELGHVIKLLGVVSQDADGRVFASVYPALVEKHHQIAAVNGVLNAVYLKGTAVGPILLTGAGAGKLPTASSVLSDLLSVTRQLATGHAAPPSLSWFATEHAAELMPIDELQTEYYLRLTALDKPGVLAKVTGILGDEGISIRALFQKPEHDSDRVPIFITTHACLHRHVRKALEKLEKLDVLTDKIQVLRFWK